MNYGRKFMGMKKRRFLAVAAIAVMILSAFGFGAYISFRIQGVSEAGKENLALRPQERNETKAFSNADELQSPEKKTETDAAEEKPSYEEGDRLMEHQFSDGAIPESLNSGNLVDIKLFRAGSEDLVVISKTVVISRNANILSFYLNTKEQEYLREASTEGLIFVVLYANKFQSPSMVTYLPGYEKK